MSTETMHAIRVHAYGGPEQLALEQIPLGRSSRWIRRHRPMRSAKPATGADGSCCI
jgi:hypothetical protein